MTELSVDTDRLAVAMPALQEVSTVIGGILAVLDSSLQNLGTPWGNDETGKTFFSTYGPTQQSLTSGLADSRSSVDNATQGLLTMVTGFTDTESLNLAAAKNLTDPAGDNPSNGPAEA